MFSNRKHVFGLFFYLKKLSSYNYFKEVPKSPSITHMKDLQNRLSFITSFLPNIHGNYSA
ncbi:hypothetical protein BLX06_34775 [Bacillus cereus]|uniref:Uncharacterized protein n=1 Tax=Bacillus cereus TaxID=1396 RepID=A0A9X6B278_BACCE|nr:hypothetical protein BLX06_34775 [Bacillus cereus]